MLQHSLVFVVREVCCFATQAMTLCFPDTRVVVHDGLPLNFSSPPAGLKLSAGVNAAKRDILACICFVKISQRRTTYTLF